MTTATCLECGAPRTKAAEFCKSSCRMDWNNRRRKRGAEIYDLFMVIRHERGLAKAMGLWTLICRLATHYREEDFREREGRRSWRKPQQVIAGKPYLRAIIGINLVGKGALR